MQRNMIADCLSREHKEVAQLLGRFSSFLRLHNVANQPDWTAFETKSLMRKIENVLNDEIQQHFDFEENSIFPLLENERMTDLLSILIAEHRLLRRFFVELRPLIALVASGSEPLPQRDWGTLLRQGTALAAELISHIEKEEAGLIPAIEETIDESIASQMYIAYTAEQQGRSIPLVGFLF
jgi:hemerythrin-like domain-containing protein